MPDVPPVPPMDFGMTDIEEALRGPDGQAVRAALMARLDQRSAEFAAKLKSGLPPAEYGRADAIAKALAAAREIVIAFPQSS
jgi:hypothetical protein